VGEIKNVGEIKSYVTYPPDKSTKYGILFIPDAFGLELNNNKLLADDLARAGYLTVIPDVFRGEPAPESLMLGGMHDFNWGAWLGKHTASVVEGILEATIKGMHELGVQKIGAVGYCFGGKYVVRFLAQGKDVDAGFIAHPSFVEASEVEAIKGPLSIAAAETDHVFGPDRRHETEEILLKKDVPYQLALYGDCEHGFAVRTDLKDRKKRFAKESAYFQAVRWFDEWLKN